MQPSWAARLLVVTIAAVGLAVAPAMFGIALGYLAHLPVLGGALAWCRDAIGLHVPIPGWLGLVATGVLAWAGFRLLSVRRNWRRFRCAHPNAVEVVASDALFAYTMPGAGGQIVLSSGLLDQLDARELAVVVAHEETHARHRHDRYLLVGELITAIVPLVRPLQRRLRFVLERWADEDAVRRLDADRTMVARTLATVALSQRPTPTFAVGIVGLGVAGRVDALLDPPTVRRPGAWAAVTSAGIAAVLAAAAVQLHHIVPVLASLCPG